jgi:hypothetical protein
MPICIICNENETQDSSRVRACCSHLVPVCDSCGNSGRRQAQHEKCPRCSGRLTVEEERLREEEDARMYELSILSDDYDDYLYESQEPDDDPYGDSDDWHDWYDEDHHYSDDISMSCTGKEQVDPALAIPPTSWEHLMKDKPDIT